MAIKYRKVDPRIWRDEKFRFLDQSDQLITLYTITAQVNRIGIFNFSPGRASEELKLDYETFIKRFGNVCQTFKWSFDATMRVLYLPTWWKYNFPENANVLKGNLKDLHDVPATSLIDCFYTNIRYLGTYTETFTQTLAEHYPKRPAIQEQEQEQEQLIIPKGIMLGTAAQPDTLNEDTPPKVKIPYKKIIDLLNERAGTEFQHTTKVTRSKIKARFNEGFTFADFETVIDHIVSEWATDEKYCDYIRPITIFSTKFEGYLQAAKKKGKDRGGRLGTWKEGKQ